jgi:NodT family efflux transporter outer membrane factor (OMF) lipoprotein
MVGPEYCRPPVPVADVWIDQNDQRLSDAPPDDAQWWTVFGDPVLNELVLAAYEQNLPIREAGLRVMQARAVRAIVAGELFPQSQEMFGQYTRNQISVSGSQIPSSVLRRNFDFWQTGFNAAWEIDFWGRFRRAIEAADADLDATVEDYDAVLVILVADTAATYVAMRTFEKQLELARQNVEIQQGSLGVAQARVDAGSVSRLDTEQAKSNLAQTEALVPEFEQGVRQTQNALCVLLGMPPQDLTDLLGGPPKIPTAANNVAIGIPAELLRRRPDVRRAERLVAAQSARIGVATSDLYPRFFITGSIGVTAFEFDELFTSESFNGSIGPGFSWNILNYGRLLNNIRANRAVFDQLVVQYQQTVLEANRETEDAVVGFFREQERMAALARSADAAKQSVDLVLVQYKEGSVDFNRVFNLQELLVRQQQALAESQGTIAANLIAIYKSLGGGWQIRCTNLAPSIESLPAIESEPPALPTQPQAPAASAMVAPLPSTST